MAEAALDFGSFPRAGPPATSSPPGHRRHLVLHMDINKTILMSDQVTGKAPNVVVNEVLAEVSWGTEIEGQWRLLGQEPQTLRPASGPEGKEMLNYMEWVTKVLPGGDNKKRRNTLTGSFTSAGQPGEAFAEHAKHLHAALVEPDGSSVQLISAFFELLVFLKRERRSFTMCFRTFGEDMEPVLAELNLFCEGRHPRYPGVCMDGSDGEPDYRIYPGDPLKCGTFHREDSRMSLIMGTWEQPGEGKYKDVTDRSLDFYKVIPTANYIVGLDAVQEFLTNRFARCGTLCLRDCHYYWKHKGQTSSGGKVFFMAPLKQQQHEIFFDDNIRYDDPYIVHPIHLADPEGILQWVSPLFRTHLCRALPWEAISDHQWFVKQVRRLEEGLERKTIVQKRFRTVLKKMFFSRKLKAGLHQNGQKVPEKYRPSEDEHYPGEQGSKTEDQDIEY